MTLIGSQRCCRTGSAAIQGSQLQLTNGSNSQAASAFLSTPLDVAQFTTQFRFQLTNAQADGFTFAIEGAQWDWYLGWLLSFGNRLIVLEPDNLRTLLFETARATADHHARLRRE